MADNNATGNLKVDAILLASSWILAFINPAFIPIILSSVASFMVIVNQIIQYKNRKKHK